MLSAPAFEWLRDLTKTTNRLGTPRREHTDRIMEAVS